MDRKAIANETIEILRQGFYEYKGKKIEILEEQKKAVKQTKLITPEEGERLIKKIVLEGKETEDIRVENISTVQAILEEKKEEYKNINNKKKRQLIFDVFLPFPITNFWHINTIFMNIFFMFN